MNLRSSTVIWEELEKGKGGVIQIKYSYMKLSKTNFKKLKKLIIIPKKYTITNKMKDRFLLGEKNRCLFCGQLGKYH